MSRHAVIKLSLRAQIGEHNFNDVVQYIGSFAMNSIPTASINVAVGRNVDTNALATIHDALKDLTTQLKAEVFLRAQITSLEQAEPGLPDGQEFKIFEGKVSGVGWQRSTHGASFSINIIHWLGDLNYASAISASSHPGNPADLTYPSIFRVLGSGDSDAKTGLGSWVPMLSKSIVNESAFSDLWGNVLRPWLIALTKDDPFDVEVLGGQAGGGDDNTLAALENMKPNVDGRPLAFAGGGGNREALSDGIRQALMNETGGNFTNTTLWGKLIGEWAPAYWFSVVPRITDTLIVPFAGGLQGQPWAVIRAEDYNQANLEGQMHQVLRGVGIIHPTMFFSGIDNNKGAVAVDRGGFAGWYQPASLKKGMVLIKDAPKWLSDPITPYIYGATAEAVSGGVVGSSLDPVNTGAPRTPARDIAQVQNDFKDVLNLYAKQWYVLESLKGRVGEVSGKLRFDIAPGSNVLVKAGGARNVEGNNSIAEDIYATVTQVSYVINSENQKAGTAFSLAHIRSQQENTTEGTSIERPPLYTDPWPGAALVAGNIVPVERVQ